MAIEDFYQTLTLKTPTNTLNSMYETTKTYANTTINGYIGSRNDIEQFVGGKWVIKSQYKCYTDTNLVFGQIITFNSENYRVVSDSQNTINIGHHYKTLVEKMEGVD